jgi:ABC-2 type transport system ATP-binding protein
MLEIRALFKSDNLRLESDEPIPFSLEDAFIGEVQRAGGAEP